MSAIINSIIARKAGQASTQHESSASHASTIGHRQDQPGLRGHSVGESYPYGVVGFGQRWALTLHGQPFNINGQYSEIPAIYTTCELAHRLLARCPDVIGNGGLRATPISWGNLADYLAANPSFALPR